MYNRVNGRLKKCSADTCVVKMTDIFDFEWDTLYVFPPMTNYKPKYQEFQDIARRLVFVKNSEVIYREDEVAVDKPYSVYFISEQLFYVPESAVFYAEKGNEYSGYNYITLRPVDSLKK